MFFLMTSLFHCLQYLRLEVTDIAARMTRSISTLGSVTALSPWGAYRDTPHRVRDPVAHSSGGWTITARSSRSCSTRFAC